MHPKCVLILLFCFSLKNNPRILATLIKSGDLIYCGGLRNYSFTLELLLSMYLFHSIYHLWILISKPSLRIDYLIEQFRKAHDLIRHRLYFNYWPKLLRSLKENISPLLC